FHGQCPKICAMGHRSIFPPFNQQGHAHLCKVGATLICLTFVLDGKDVLNPNVLTIHELEGYLV
ncbi:hypothetical protein ACQP3D_30710, partial [Escherichia coli]